MLGVVFARDASLMLPVTSYRVMAHRRLGMHVCACELWRKVSVSGWSARPGWLSRKFSYKVLASSRRPTNRYMFAALWRGESVSGRSAPGRGTACGYLLALA